MAKFNLIYSLPKDAPKSDRRPVRVAAREDTVLFYEEISGTEDYFYYSGPCELLDPMADYETTRLSLILEGDGEGNWYEHSVRPMMEAQEFARVANLEGKSRWISLAIYPELG